MSKQENRIRENIKNTTRHLVKFFLTIMHRLFKMQIYKNKSSAGSIINYNKIESY